MYSPLRFTGHILRKKRPIQLTFFVTRRCNAGCPFCFYLQAQEQVDGDSGELTLREIEEIAPSFGNLLWLAFSGGEVYLRDDIVDVSRVFYKHTRPSIILYSTNGLTPERIKSKTESILKSCPDSVVAVKLSLDGLNAEHDALRGVPGGFEKVLETYHKLSELLGEYSNFELGFNTVFCSANQNCIDKVFDFGKSLDHVQTHTLSMIRGNLNDKGLKQVDLSKYKSAIDKMEADLKKKLTGRYRFAGARLKSAQDILQRRLIYQTIVRQKRLLPCYAGRLNLVLTENGDVYPCEVLDKKIGNVKDFDYDARKLLQSNRYKSVVKEIDDTQCYCSHECYFMTNILFNPGMYPALFREYLQL